MNPPKATNAQAIKLPKSLAKTGMKSDSLLQMSPSTQIPIPPNTSPKIPISTRNGAMPLTIAAAKHLCK